jgi:hypothetical protein
MAHKIQRHTYQFSILIKNIMKAIDEQLDKEIHGARSGRISNERAFSLWG